MRAESLLSATDRALVLRVDAAADKCRLARAVFNCEAATKPTKTVRRDLQSTAMLLPAEVHKGEYTVHRTQIMPDAPSLSAIHADATADSLKHAVSVTGHLLDVLQGSAAALLDAPTQTWRVYKRRACVSCVEYM